MICVIAYSRNSSGGHEKRVSILHATILAWELCGFQIQIVTDTLDLRLPLDFKGNVIHTNLSGTCDQAENIPWQALAHLSTVASKDHAYVAYSEDDVVMPLDTFNHYTQHRASIKKLGCRLGFYRVQRGNELPESWHKDRNESFVKSVFQFEGNLYAEMVQPYCACWIMTSEEYFDEYLPSPMSRWDTAVSHTPWGRCETAGSGLLVSTPPRRNVVSVFHGKVMHTYPAKGFDAEVFYTVDDLIQFAQTNCIGCETQIRITHDTTTIMITFAKHFFILVVYILLLIGPLLLM